MMYCETDSAFYAYYEWCEIELSRWEYEQELAETEEPEESYEDSDWFNDPNNVMSHYHY